jgi:SAM-dependent methyltransferase
MATVVSSRSAAPSAAALQELLGNLYRRQQALDPDHVYFQVHGQPSWIRNHVRTFLWYRRYIPAGATVLDWGCHHGPDSCLLRAWYGGRLELYGCDHLEADTFSVFRDYSQALYTHLQHPVRLPYEDSFFDAVVASGVLEHVAMDYESLKELYRVLKPGGMLLISYLPNRLSYQEWYLRVIKNNNFHRRFYGLSEARQLLKHCGLFPVAAGYHTFLWENLLARIGLGAWSWTLAHWPARLLPVHIFCSTLYLAAQKMTVM